MKLLIETTGEFMLIDFSQNGLVIEHNRPTVSSENSTFVSSRAAVNQVKVIASLSDDASDAEFVQYWNDSMPKLSANASEEEKAKAESERRTLAIDSFIAAYPANGENVEPEAVKTPSKRGPKAKASE